MAGGTPRIDKSSAETRVPARRTGVPLPESVKKWPSAYAPTSMKFLERIVVTDTFDDGGKQGNIQNGWSWYAGI